MDNAAIPLAALGIVATAMAALVWIVKYLLKEIRTSLDKNSESHDRVAEATIANTAASIASSAASTETLVFMRKLNGRLGDITAEKISRSHDPR